MSCQGMSTGRQTSDWCPWPARSTNAHLGTFLVWVRYCQGPTMRCSETGRPWAQPDNISCRCRSPHWQRTRGRTECEHMQNSDWAGWPVQRISKQFRALSKGCNSCRPHTRSLEQTATSRGPNCSRISKPSGPWGAIDMSSSIRGLRVGTALTFASFRKFWSIRDTWIIHKYTLRVGREPNPSRAACWLIRSCRQFQPLCSGICTTAGRRGPKYPAGSSVCHLGHAEERPNWRLHLSRSAPSCLPALQIDSPVVSEREVGC